MKPGDSTVGTHKGYIERAAPKLNLKMSNKQLGYIFSYFRIPKFLESFGKLFKTKFYGNPF